MLRYSTQPNELLGQISLPENLRIMALDTGVKILRGSQTTNFLRIAGAMGLRIIQTIYRDLGQQHTPLHGYLGSLSPGVYRRYFRTLLPRRLRGSDFLAVMAYWRQRMKKLIRKTFTECGPPRII